MACVIGLSVYPAEAYVLGPTSPGDWGASGGPVSLTYSFMATGVAYDETALGLGAGTFTHLNATMPGGWQAEIVAAMNSWANVSGLSFSEVADLGEAFGAAQTSGDLRFGGQTFDGAFGVLAHGFYPPNNGGSAAGDMHFDVAENWTVNSLNADNSTIDIFQVAAHELGHALGLNHTAVPNSLMNAAYTETFSGPQADDIAGVQFLFGGAPGAPEPLTMTLGIIVLATLGFRISRQRTSTERLGEPC